MGALARSESLACLKMGMIQPEKKPTQPYLGQAEHDRQTADRLEGRSAADDRSQCGLVDHTPPSGAAHVDKRSCECNAALERGMSVTRPGASRTRQGQAVPGREPGFQRSRWKSTSSKVWSDMSEQSRPPLLRRSPLVPGVSPCRYESWRGLRPACLQDTAGQRLC